MGVRLDRDKSNSKKKKKKQKKNNNCGWDVNKRLPFKALSTTSVQGDGTRTGF
jgi:hypothetical protein